MLLTPAVPRRVHGTKAWSRLGFQSLGFQGFRVSGFQGLGFRVSGFRVSGFQGLGSLGSLGFRVWFRCPAVSEPLALQPRDWSHCRGSW